MRRRDLVTIGLVAAASSGFAPRFSFAQGAYPTRPIRLIIPFPPGGGFDAIGRPWAEKIQPLLGTVVVENEGGGGSSLGAATVAHSQPDGYTILLGGSSTHITEAILKTRPLYDPIRDFEPISNIAVSAFAIAVNPSIPANTLQEFIDYDKAQSRQAFLWSRWCWLAQPSNGRIVQVVSWTARPCSGSLSRLRTGDRRHDRRSRGNGDARGDRTTHCLSSYR